VSQIAQVLCLLTATAELAVAQDSVRCVPEGRLGPQTLPAGYAMSALVQDVAGGLSRDGHEPTSTAGTVSRPRVSSVRGPSICLAGPARTPKQTGPRAIPLGHALAERSGSTSADPFASPARARSELCLIQSATFMHFGETWRTCERSFRSSSCLSETLLPRTASSSGCAREVTNTSCSLVPGRWGDTVGLAGRGLLMHGTGTPRAIVERPTYERWIVRSAPGSLGRLWLFDDPQRPEDRGLYYCDFAVESVCRG